MTISTFTIKILLLLMEEWNIKGATIVANGVEQLWVIYTKERSLGTWEHF